MAGFGMYHRRVLTGPVGPPLQERVSEVGISCYNMSLDFYFFMASSNQVRIALDHQMAVTYTDRDLLIASETYVVCPGYVYAGHWKPEKADTNKFNSGWYRCVIKSKFLLHNYFARLKTP